MPTKIRSLDCIIVLPSLKWWKPLLTIMRVLSYN